MTRWTGLAMAFALAATAVTAVRLSQPETVASRATSTIRSETLRKMAAARARRFDPNALSFSARVAAIAATGQNFDALGDGFSGPSGPMTVSTATPDPSAAVGPNHYVETAGGQLAVFDKTGVPIVGPVPVATLWSGFGGACEAATAGSATVLHDQLADRWVIGRFALTDTTSLACVAVSATADPAGTYARYAFPTTAVAADGTFAAWADAYYSTFASGGPIAAPGTAVCAYDRAQMLAAQPATQQCFSLPDAGVLPANLDGSAPDAGTPLPLLSLGADHASLRLHLLHVDWATPASSSINGPIDLPVTGWIDPSSPSIPQAGAGDLDPAAGRLMRRMAYRARDGYGSIVATHTTAAAAAPGTALRWYEIALPSGVVDASPAVVQQGTWTVDGTSRWVGGIAMDHAGNIALGYNASSPSLTPGLRYTGRLASDAPGQMTQGEGTIVDGAGAQTAGTEWGRFSSMAVDPSDDCTFWFTGEYLAGDGSFNWRTRVGSFTLPECSGPAANDFTLSAVPSSLTVEQHAFANTSIASTLVSGSAETITLAVTGMPAGAFVTLAPASIATGGSASLTIDGGTAAPGVYAIDVTGTSPSAQHVTSLALTIVAGPDFGVSVAPAAQTVAPGGSASYTVTTSALNGSTQSIALSVTGLPAGVSSSFTPATVVAGGSATLTLTTTNGTPLATTPFTVTGTSGPITHTATASLTVGFAVPVAVLANGVPVTGLSGTTGSNKYFVLNVPDGQDSLVFTINGGTPDVDLYVRYGALPTTSTYNCRPFTSGNAETCTFSAPQAGNWFVMLRGYTSYSGVTLTGTYAADTTPALTNGVPVTGISGATGSQQFWKLTVPAGQLTLSFKISGGTGDADLYVRNGSKPTSSSYNCRPYLTGNNETCTFNSPAAGVWYVMVRGFSAFSGVTLVGTYGGGDTTPALTNGVPITGISGATGSQQYWMLAVPASATSVSFVISGGTGDADLYVRRGAKPTTTTYNCRPYLNGNNESCTLSNSGDNTYFVMIRGFTSFSGVTLRGSY